MNELIARLQNWVALPVAFLDDVCAAYRTVTEEQRATFRAVVRNCPFVRHEFLQLLRPFKARVGLGVCSTSAEAQGAHRDFAKYLETALTVVSITGGFGDSRGTLTWLDDLWMTAERNEIDPMPFFVRIADLSDTEESRSPLFGRSTRGLILLAVPSGRSDNDCHKEAQEAGHPAMPETLSMNDLSGKIARLGRWHDGPSE